MSNKFFNLVMTGSLMALTSTISGCSSGSIGFTNWKTLGAGEAAVIYHPAGSAKDDIEVVTGKFNFGPLDKVYQFNTAQQLATYTSRTDQGQPIDQSIGFAANGVPGKINAEVTLSIDATVEGAGKLVKELKVDDDEFMAKNLYSATQGAIIEIGANMDPSSFNTNLPKIAGQVKDRIQKDFEMVKIIKVRFVGIADFGPEYNAKLKEAEFYRTATKNEVEKQAQLREQIKTNALEAQATQALPADVRAYQLEQKRLDIMDEVAKKGGNPFATGVTLTPTKQ
jgi:SPFH domain / Band 7 family